MSHPIRIRTICAVRFYRMGRALIADKGKLRFVVQQYSNGGWEARWQRRDGLQMPIGGDVCKTLREAIAYLRPAFEGAT